MSPRLRQLLSAIAFSACTSYLASCGSATRSLPIAPPGDPTTGPTSAAAGPLLGAWWDPQAGGLRVIYGVPGAAVEGPAIDNDGTYSGGSACIRGKIAVLTTSAGGLFLGTLSGGVPVSLSSEKITGAQVVFSPSCSVALAFSSHGSTGMLLQGLLSTPRATRIAFSGPISAAAVADDGSILTASQRADGTAPVLLLSAGSSSPRSVTTLSRLGGLAYLPGTGSALLADAGRQMVLEANQMTGNLSLATVAGPSDGITHPFAIRASVDGRWAVVANQNSSTLIRIDLSGQSPAARTVCRCSPTTLEPLAGNLAFRANSPNSGIIWAYDGGSATPRFTFLPADRAQATSSQGLLR